MKRSLILLLLVAHNVSVSPAQDQSSQWSIDESLQQLQYHPDDAYLHYVTHHLSRQLDRRDVREAMERIQRRQRSAANRRVDNVNLFSIFAGSLAVQESLQLDTLRDGAELDLGAVDEIDVSTLQGPTVKSHPWAEMLGDRRPETSPLARSVPADFYYIRFDTVANLLDVLQTGDAWGAHLFSQTKATAHQHLLRDRLLQQLALEASDALQPVYDWAIAELAVTGSDLYVTEGSDVTLLFRLNQPAAFRAAVDGLLDAAAGQPGVRREVGTYREVEYVHVASSDRRIHVYSANPAADLHLRSNSLAALRRVLDAHLSPEDKSLATTDEFQYVRTLMEYGDEREQGLIYFSDAFIRRLIGPHVKLTEYRRVRCHRTLRLIAYAGLLYTTQTGNSAESLSRLSAEGFLPAADADAFLRCPCGGSYSLDENGLTPRCSFHGADHELRPCLEVVEDRVTAQEASEYRDFVEDYSAYWRTFFDPIAIRLQVTPERYRAETIVLPLINNSIYQRLFAMLGGEPANLDAAVVPDRNVFSLAVQVDKEGLTKRGIQVPFGAWLPTNEHINEAELQRFFAHGIGDQVGLHVYDADPMFEFQLVGLLGQMIGSFRGRSGLDGDFFAIAWLVASLNSPIYLSVPLDDIEFVDSFMGQVDSYLAELARQSAGNEFFRLQQDFYHYALRDGTSARSAGIQFGPLKWRFFWARIRETLYFASKPEILEDLAKLPSDSNGGSAEPAHAMVRVRPQNWNRVTPAYQLGWAERNRHACLHNVGRLLGPARYVSASGEAVSMERVAAVSRQLYGVQCYCPEGGEYVLQSGVVACTRHGDVAHPRQAVVDYDSASGVQQVIDSFGGLTATLTFLEDGLHGVLTLDRR